MSRPCKACEGIGQRRSDPSVFFCAACLGSGSVVESIPAADAIADAETLRANVVGMWCRTKRERDMRAELRDAAAWAVTAVRDGSVHCATNAARNAFRAVPELRA